MSKSNDPTPQAFGVFKHPDGHTVTAEDIATAVRLRFDGWEEVNPPAPENIPGADAENLPEN